MTLQVLLAQAHMKYSNSNNKHYEIKAKYVQSMKLVIYDIQSSFCDLFYINFICLVKFQYRNDYSSALLNIVLSFVFYHLPNSLDTSCYVSLIKMRPSFATFSTKLIFNSYSDTFNVIVGYNM